MKKLLATIAFGIAATIGLGSGAQAAYPPDTVGSINIGAPICTFEPGGDLTEWSVTFQYEVYVPNAWLLVVNPTTDDVIMTYDVPIGPGTVTIDSNTPGANVGYPIVGNFIVGLQTEDDYISAQSEGCVIDSIPDTTPPPYGPGVEVDPHQCEWDDVRPYPNLIGWSIRIVAYTPNDNDMLIVTGANGDPFYAVDLEQGETVVSIGSSTPGFEGPMAGFADYTVILLGDSDSIEVATTPCLADGFGGTTSGPPTSGPTTSGPTTSGPTTSGPTTSGPTTSGPTTSSSTSTSTSFTTSTTLTPTTVSSTSSTLAPGTKLPKTGAGTGSTAMMALLLCMGGAGLVLVTYRQRTAE